MPGVDDSLHVFVHELTSARCCTLHSVLVCILCLCRTFPVRVLLRGEPCHDLMTEGFYEDDVYAVQRFTPHYLEPCQSDHVRSFWY